MPVAIEVACPLCNAPASCHALDTGNLRHVRCSSCAEFVISLPADNKVRSFTSDVRRHLAFLTTQARAGEILSITVPLSEHIEGTANPSLDVRYIDRTSAFPGNSGFVA